MLNTSSLSLIPAYASMPTQLAVISEKVDAAPQDLFTRCPNILRNLSPDDLIVVDNFDVLPEGIQQSASEQSEDAAFCKEPLLTELLSLRCKLLISTRCNFQQLQLSLPFHCMEGKELDTPSLMKLFTYYYLRLPARENADCSAEELKKHRSSGSANLFSSKSIPTQGCFSSTPCSSDGRMPKAETSMLHIKSQHIMTLLRKASHLGRVSLS